MWIGSGWFRLWVLFGAFLLGVLWGCLFLGPWCFPPFSFFVLSFPSCSWGLRSTEPWGYLWFLFFSFLSFLFFVDIGTFMNIEHDTALLHMSTYITERWHRAHGRCMCRGGEAPFVRNSTTTTHTHTHTTFFPAAVSAAHPVLPPLSEHFSANIPSFWMLFKAAKKIVERYVYYKLKHRF